jgi:hypothetical protein
MTRKHLTFWIMLGGLVLFFSQPACTSDTIDPPDLDTCDTLVASYNVEVKPIIDATCAYAGCHASGSADGDFSDYGQLLPYLDNGSLETRVLDLGDMPPNNVPVEKELSEEDQQVLRCWLINGYPEM